MSGAMLGIVYCGFGKHMNTIPPHWLMEGFKAYLIAQLGYILTVLFMKLSVCTFYLRIAVLKWQVWTVYALMGINAIYTIGYFILILNQCTPASFLWTQLRGAKGHCLPNRGILGTSYTHNPISILSDWILATMPLFMLKGSKLNRRANAAVLFLLGLGYFASISSMSRMQALPSLNRTDDYTRTGPGGRYSSSRFAAWSLGRRTREHGYVMNGNGHDLGSAEPQATSIVSAGLAFPDVRGTSDEELGILKQAEVDVTGHGERRSRARKGKRITGDRADGPQ
ncbi:Cell wall galactomannoprotein [Macrophomina phaseolina MS6]|uniref:Cell wall galactomannoprotein n=1 Tax=Macrophomina phaseolina (strain MS6) TaxID=1126212 RepID=K2RQ10_MACPH|nr:Cell wall galactomannoprotein [Macrophomina phaseolina MS6]